MIKTVIKRDGREVEFNTNRIINAIELAMRDTKQGVDKELSIHIANDISEINKDKMTVEEIQDMVEDKLMDSRKDVAKEYIKYRNERNKARQLNKDLYKTTHDILNCNNITNDNANIDQYSFSGKENRVGEELHKQYAKDNLLRPEVRKAFENNDIYMHDFGKYGIGMHNCSFTDMKRLLRDGFATRNGDVRGANSFSSACQLYAVVFQCQSQVQFGGVGSCHADFDLEPYVCKSFKKHYKNGLKYIEQLNDREIECLIGNYKIRVGDDRYKKLYPRVWQYAYDMLDQEGRQSTQALYHNLNTLESRAGSQVPFTSINLGRDTTVEGRLINKWIFQASIDGIGKLHRTSIFPISIFQYKKGVNNKKGTPNYDIKQLAIESMCKRIYPNWVNCDFTNHSEDKNNIDTMMATMGCVDGQEIITYKINDKLYVESFERMWNRLSKLFKVKEQQSQGNYYMDLHNIKIYDTIKGFVDTYKLIKNKDKGDWTRIKFSNGRTLLATSDHPLPIINRGRTYVKDLNIGDMVTINQEQFATNEIAYDIDKAWLLGMILCDGCYDGNITTSINAVNEDDIESKYKEVFEKIFKLKIDTKLHQRGQKGNYKDLICHGEQVHIKNTLQQMFGGVKKIDRHIPNEVFTWNREAKLSFLAGMIDADGYINSTGHSGSTVQIGSTNKELALQTMALAQSLGLISKVYINHYDKQHKEKIRYRIEFTANLELLKFLSCHKKINCFVREANITNTNHATIIDIEVLGDLSKYSYDVTTASDHFEVSGIYSHNCRTMLGYDRFSGDYNKVGRGNIVPTTIILPKLGIKHGIVTGKRTKADIQGFWQDFDRVLDTTRISLIDRFNYIVSQSPKSAPFMYNNGTMLNTDKCVDNVYETMKHNTLAIGYIGIAEMCQALFGKNHAEDEKVKEFALSVVKHIYDYCKQCSEEYNLNFSCYATPSENLCNVAMKKLQKEFGVIPKVTEKEYLTNSHHVPVWEKVSIFKKLEIEAPFCYYATGGCITYIELESSIINNKQAVEKIIDYAMDLNIPYLAFNFPIDTCLDCGYQGEFNNKCIKCGSDNIEQLRRVTGYLTTDYHNFNKGKINECLDRVKHSAYTDFGDDK